MFTFDQARQLALKELEAMENRSREQSHVLRADGGVVKLEQPTGKLSLALLDESTRTEEFGWVFFYQCADYLRTGSSSDQLADNAPIIVCKHTGKIETTGTERPIEHYIDAFAKHGTCYPE